MENNSNNNNNNTNNYNNDCETLALENGNVIKKLKQQEKDDHEENNVMSMDEENDNNVVDNGDYDGSVLENMKNIKDSNKTVLHDNIYQNILKYNIEYPICSYSTISRRQLPEEALTLKDKLDLLVGWNKHSVIAIDGQNGTTKSTLCMKLRRKYLKINVLAPEITGGSNYNYDPLRSLEYLSIQLLTKSASSVWDRCMFSNLIFYYVHHLMYKFRNRTMPTEVDEIWPILNNLAYNTNLRSTINYCRSRNDIPTIFIVCSNVDYIAIALRKRYDREGASAVNDLWNSKEYNYQMAQYHTYNWFGKLMDYPVFDLQEFFDVGYSLDEIHTILASKIDYCLNDENSICELPNRNSALELYKLLLPMTDDVLIYERSKK